jgi:hypothetical protein
MKMPLSDRLALRKIVSDISVEAAREIADLPACGVSRDIRLRAEPDNVVHSSSSLRNSVLSALLAG